MIVAALQPDVAWQDPPANFDRVERLAEGAAALGARLLALPEMFATGFTMDADRAAAQCEQTAAFLASLARRHGAWVLGGLAQAGPSRPHNSCLVYAPDGGEAGRYHKLHPFSPAGEDRHYAAGEALLHIQADGLRVTPLICYDLRFPEPFRIAASRTDLFVVIASWPATRASAWKCLLEARAIENQAYVLGVNRIGEGDGVLYVGDSALHDPLGRVLARSGDAPAVVAGPVDAELVARSRARFGFLADRRPDLYARLEPTGN